MTNPTTPTDGAAVAVPLERQVRPLRRNLPTPGGRECGANMARLIEPAIAELAAAGEPDERCSTCAFRLGTLPNGCVETVMDATKCGMEGKPFYCHDRRRKGETCHGWFAMRYALDGKDAAVPWKYSDEYSSDEQAA